MSPITMEMPTVKNMQDEKNEQDIMKVLTREGVVMNLTIRYWRAHRKLNAEELGLDPKKVDARLFSLGHKKLVDADVLKPFALIESRSRARVEFATFSFLGGLGRFLPNQMIPSFIPELDAFQAEFYSGLERFKDHYDDYRQDAKLAWWEAAKKLATDPDALVEAIEAAYPTVEQLDRHFEYRYDMISFKLPEILDEHEFTVEQSQDVIRARNEAARRAAGQIQENVTSFVGDCVSQMRGEVADLIDEMLRSMDEGKVGVHQRTLNRLSTFIDRFKSLNFAGDSQLDAYLDQVKRDFLNTSAQHYRENKASEIRLRTGLSQLGKVARELADESDLCSFGKIGNRRLSL